MRKTIFRTAFLAMTVVFLSSCSNDNNSAPKSKVRYRVTASDNMVTSLEYRNADGDLVDGQNGEIILDWDKTVNVDRPFLAEVNVNMTSTSTSTQEYNVAIYVDDVLENFSPGIIPPMGTKSESVTVNVEE